MQENSGRWGLSPQTPGEGWGGTLGFRPADDLGGSDGASSVGNSDRGRSHGIKGGAQRPHPECQGLARLPAKETLIYVKKPGSAPKGLTFHGGGGACCSLAADLSPRAEALKSGHGRPRLAFRGPALRSVLWKRLQNPRAERFIPSERAAGKGCRVRRTPARNNFICQERLAADIGRVI